MTAGDTDHPGGVITSFVLIDRGPPVLCCGLITLIWLKIFKKAPLPRVKILITSEGFLDFSHPCKPLPPNANNPSLARRLWGPWWKQEPSMWRLRISLFVVIMVKSRRALVLVLPSTADPKSWSGAEGIQVITCSLSSQGVFCVRQVSHKRENLWEEGLQRTSFRNVEEHELAGLCLFYSFLQYFFPISLHGAEMKPQRPYDRKFSEIKEEGGLQCGIDAALTLKTSPFNGEALNATTIQVLGRCHGKDNGSLMVFLYGDRRRRKKKKTYCTGGPWPRCLWWLASRAAPRLRLQTQSEEDRGDS